jgi:hypothetical protein
MWWEHRKAGHRPDDVGRQSEAAGRAVLTFEHQQAQAAQGPKSASRSPGIYSQALRHLPR